MLNLVKKIRMIFPFTDEYQIIILNYLYQLFDEISDIKMSFVYMSNSGEIKKYEIKNNKKQVFTVEKDDDLTYYIDIRKKKKICYYWELAEHYQHNFITQLKIDNENDNYNLIMRFDSYEDENQDLLSITFRKNLSFLSFENYQNILIPENKRMLAAILYKTISAKIIDIMEFKHEIFQINNDVNKILLRKAEEREANNYNHRRIVNDYLNKIISNFVKTNNIKKTFIINEIVITKIINNNLSLKEIDLTIEKTLEMAYRLNFCKNEIIINEDYLSIQLEKEENKNSFAEKENKVIYFLEKVELTILKLIKEENKITGSIVGKYLEPAISAAAISEYVAKHVDEIIELIKTNPEKYPMIQKHFRPIMNKMPRSYKVENY